MRGWVWEPVTGAYTRLGSRAFGDKQGCVHCLDVGLRAGGVTFASVGEKKDMGSAKGASCGALDSDTWTVPGPPCRSTESLHSGVEDCATQSFS